MNTQFNCQAVPNAPTTPLQPGLVLFGEYQILEGPLGGGMGQVYRARHQSLGTFRAIKVIRPDTATPSRLEDFFLREARVLIKVNHSAVVRCHDLLRQGNQAYLVMEFVEGPSLRALLQERRFTVSEILTLRARLAGGLAAAHAFGVTHRDVSPDNIIIPNGRVEEAKLIDFGIALDTASDVETQVAGFEGKLAYAAPEQLGLFGGNVGGRSDVYSLGLVLSQAAGYSLPLAQTFYEALELRKRTPPRFDELAPELRKSLLPMLNPDPRLRPDAAELAVLQPPTSRRSKLRPSLIYPATAILAGLLSGAVLSRWNW